MAGSNGSPAQRGGPPPHWPVENDEQARALEIERWHQQQAQQRGYQTPHGQSAHPGYAQPSHHQAYDQGPSHGYSQPHDHEPQLSGGRQQYPPQDFASAGVPRNPFAPQFERFAPAQQDRTAPPDLHGHGRYEQSHAPAYDPVPPAPDLRPTYDPHRQPLQHDPRGAAAPGYFPPQQGFAPEARAPDGRADPQSWDLSHYQPGQIPQGFGGHGQRAEPTHDFQGQPSWPPQQQHGAGGGEPPWSQPGHGQPPSQWQQHPGDLQGQPPHYAGHQQGYAPSHLDAGFDGHPGHPGQHDQGYEHDDVDQPDEPRRGPSTLLVVGMLVGAIVVGGGLAFAYKQFGGGGDKAKVAELKRPSSPEKVKPQDPGGKSIENTDKKFLNRLASDAPADPQRQSDVDGAAKKVSTIPIVVNRVGSLTPQAPQPPPSGESGVPGLLIDGLGPPPVPASSPPQLRTDNGPLSVGPQASRQPPPPPAVRSAPPAAPRVADLPMPKVIAAAPAATSAVDKPAAAPPKKQKVAVRDDLAAPQASTADETRSGLGSAAATPPRKPVASTSASGYVAVLASKKSRQEALNSFADLHSQYPDVLGGMTPDVREANLGDKGLWYRLIVGPPGSREAARTVCVKLKEKGFTDCWPVAY